MCVMSHSVMAYQGDRSLAASVKMMEVWGGGVNQDRKGREEEGVGVL